MSDPYPAPSYYRVSAKALVFDDDGRLLVLQTTDGLWEIPGGGWDHDEDYQACIRRELAEETGAEVEEIGPLAFFYRCSTFHGKPKISLVFPVKVSNTDNLKLGSIDDLAAMDFVDEETFKKLPFQPGENIVLQYAGQIWSVVEKLPAKG